MFYSIFVHSLMCCNLKMFLTSMFVLFFRILHFQLLSPSLVDTDFSSIGLSCHIYRKETVISFCHSISAWSLKKREKYIYILLLRRSILLSLNTLKMISPVQIGMYFCVSLFSFHRWHILRSSGIKSESGIWYTSIFFPIIFWLSLWVSGGSHSLI